MLPPIRPTPTKAIFSAMGKTIHEWTRIHTKNIRPVILSAAKDDRSRKYSGPLVSIRGWLPFRRHHHRLQHRDRRVQFLPRRGVAAAEFAQPRRIEVDLVALV